MRRGQIERVRQEGRTVEIPQRPIRCVISRREPAISRANESASGMDAYVRSNAGAGHNPNLR